MTSNELLKQDGRQRPRVVRGEKWAESLQADADQIPFTHFRIEYQGEWNRFAVFAKQPEGEVEIFDGDLALVSSFLQGVSFARTR